MIPDITTGIRDCRFSGEHTSIPRLVVLQTFMINSGLNVPIPEIPIPALEVPNAAPTAATARGGLQSAPKFRREQGNRRG